MTKWGLFDTKAKLWLGGDQGPTTFEDKTLARAAATIVTEQLGVLICARVIDAGPWKEKDTVRVNLSPEEAIRKIEAKAP